MSDIRVKCVDQTLTITNAPIIASGGVGEDRVVFDFCSLWDGYVKTAMFFTSENEGYSVLVENNAAVIPSEVMASEGFANFGVIGVNGSVTRTSEVIRYNIVRGANTVITSAPSLDIYQQILNAITGTVIPEEVREQHYRSSIKFWVGTQAEYDALTPANGTMYFITDGDADYITYAGGSGNALYRIYKSGRFEVFRHTVLIYSSGESFTQLSGGALDGGYTGSISVEWVLSSMPAAIKNGCVDMHSVTLCDEGTAQATKRKYTWVAGSKIDGNNVVVNLLSCANPGTSGPYTQYVDIHIIGTIASGG